MFEDAMDVVDDLFAWLRRVLGIERLDEVTCVSCGRVLLRGNAAFDWQETNGPVLCSMFCLESVQIFREC